MPEEIDLALRLRAEREGRSVDEVALELIAEGLGLDVGGVSYDDLDDLVGTWVEDSGFDEAMAEFGRIDEEAWK
ncbi:MAG TPA: hypothetical protein PLA50_07020 [Bacteroidia bacterium]|nr:hypothetical protein [Bacteroidia bacterium]